MRTSRRRSSNLVRTIPVHLARTSEAKYEVSAAGSVSVFSFGGIILTCYIKSAAIILQSMGNSLKSTILALLRDVIIFVPASVIIAMISKNIVTMLWAAAISDVIASVVGFWFILTEIHKFEELMKNL